MKYLVVGLGSVGQRHVRNLKTLAGLEAEILAYRPQGRDLIISETLGASVGKQPEEEYGLRLVPSLQQGLAERPRAVFVTNPIAHHVPVAIAAAEAGAHLLVEKPVGADLEGLETLSALVARQRLAVLIGYQLRFHPALRTVRGWLGEGRIGRLLSADFHFGEYLPATRPWLDYRETHMAREGLGGGAIRCLSHELDLAYWFFGVPGRVFALGGQLSSLELETEDVASLLLDYRREGRPFPVAVHLNFVERPPARHFTILGDKGSIFFDYIRNSLRTYDAQAGRWEEHEQPPFNRNQLFLDEMSHFLACLDGSARSEVDLDDGIASLQICLAARQSLQGGQPVPLPSGLAGKPAPEPR